MLEYDDDHIGPVDGQRDTDDEVITEGNEIEKIILDNAVTEFNMKYKNNTTK